MPGALFCRACGFALSGGPATQHPATKHPATQHPATKYSASKYPPTKHPAGENPATGNASDREPVAERRVCSVLFCDLVGFTPLSESRDPEAVRELLSRYFGIARTVIGRYGGVVEKFIGDAVMAVWGTPVASEEDAERAVRAGLDLVAAAGGLRRRGRCWRTRPRSGWPLVASASPTRVSISSRARPSRSGCGGPPGWSRRW